MSPQMYFEMLENLHWANLLPEEKQLTTLTLKHILEVDKEHISDSDFESKIEELFLLEYQRLKDNQSSTFLSDSKIMSTARKFSRVNGKKITYKLVKPSGSMI